MKGGAKVVIEPHRHEGVFIARGKEDALVTLNSTPGVSVYGEKRISVESPPGPDGNSVKVEYRVWNPFRSKSELVKVFFCTCLFVFLAVRSIYHLKHTTLNSRCRYSWRCRQHLDQTWLQGALSWSSCRNISLPRFRHCRSQGKCLRGRILPSSWP